MARCRPRRRAATPIQRAALGQRKGEVQLLTLDVLAVNGDDLSPVASVNARPTYSGCSPAGRMYLPHRRREIGQTFSGWPCEFGLESLARRPALSRWSVQCPDQS